MVLHKLQLILSDGHHWDWHKMSVCMSVSGVTLIECKRKRLKNSEDQLDFLEVPYLLIVLLYTFISLKVAIFLAIFPLS